MKRFSFNKITSVLTVVSITFLFFHNCNSKKISSEPVKSDAENKTSTSKKDTLDHTTIQPKKYLQIPDSFSELSIRMVGDLMCHKPQSNNAQKPDGSYDFTECFQDVKNLLSESDLTIGNLETTMAGSKLPYSGYPAFNSPDAYISALKNCGFDLLVTANNHSMDTGEEGLLRTIDVIKKNKISYTGTHNSQRDCDSIRFFNLQKIKLAVLNYTYGTNGSYPKHEHKFMLNVIDSARIYKDVKRAIFEGAEIVLVFYHFGIENRAEPTIDQLNAVRWAREAGARLIIGAHPHVVGPTKFLYPDSKHSDTAFVAYSLGNFISNQYWRYTDAGVILEISLLKNLRTGSISIHRASFIPTWVYRGENPNKKMHIVYPAEWHANAAKIPGHLDSIHVKKMREAYYDTESMMNKYHNRMVLLKTAN